MNTNPRDTQFAGFAAKLWDMLPDGPDDDDSVATYDKWCNECELILARRAYDLVQHTVGYCLEYMHECGHEISGAMNSRIQPTIPDLTKWPDQLTNNTKE